MVVGGWRAGYQSCCHYPEDARGSFYKYVSNSHVNNKVIDIYFVSRSFWIRYQITRSGEIKRSNTEIKCWDKGKTIPDLAKLKGWWDFPGKEMITN